MRKSWIQIGGKLYDKELLAQQQDLPGTSAPAVMADLPEFISPIDGKAYSGRAGLRDHCARHNVVPTADLAGLPPKPMVNNNFDPRYREDTKRTIAEVINSRNY